MAGRWAFSFSEYNLLSTNYILCDEPFAVLSSFVPKQPREIEWSYNLF